MTLRILAGGHAYPVTLSTAQAADVLGCDQDTVRRKCRDDDLPLMPRHSRDAPWRIPTARLFEALGLDYETIGISQISPSPTSDNKVEGDSRGGVTATHPAAAPISDHPIHAAGTGRQGASLPGGATASSRTDARRRSGGRTNAREAS